MIEFWVPGRPATKGSVVSRPNGSIRHTDASKEREAVIRAAARRELRHQGLDDHVPLFERTQPVSVEYVAFFPSRADADPDDPCIAHEDGDIDKLCRTVLDALTGVTYVDDAQVVMLCGPGGVGPQKHYAHFPEFVGEYICIRPVSRGFCRKGALFRMREAHQRALGFSDPRAGIPGGF